MNKNIILAISIIAAGAGLLYFKVLPHNTTAPNPADTTNTTSAKKIIIKTKATPKLPAKTNIEVGDMVSFNTLADNSKVNVYRSMDDYAGKPYLTLPVGTKNPKSVSVIAVDFSSHGSTLTKMVQVALPGSSTVVWINDYFLKIN